jgi:hypothetical protein
LQRRQIFRAEKQNYYLCIIDKWSTNVKPKTSIEVTECETFTSYNEKLKKKYGENPIGKGKCTGLELKRWLALRDNKTEIP